MIERSDGREELVDKPVQGGAKKSRICFDALTADKVRKWFATGNAGFWLFISLVFFGSMIWAKSRDPFERIWFTVKTPHYGKVKGVAVLPVHSNAKTQRGKGAEENGMMAFPRLRGSALNFPVVFYVYGSGGSLINSGNELRQLAELGMAAVAIEYNQTNQAVFEEQFIAAHEWMAKRIQNSEVRSQDNSALRVRVGWF